MEDKQLAVLFVAFGFKCEGFAVCGNKKTLFAFAGAKLRFDHVEYGNLQFAFRVMNGTIQCGIGFWNGYQVI